MRPEHKELAEQFVTELLNDLKDMIDYYDGDVPTWDYKPDAERRVERFYREYNALHKYGVDNRGRAL